MVLGIDFGTSNTVAALAAAGRAPRVLSLDGTGWLPSAVFLDEDGALVVGRDAERRARLAPERFEANPKRRIDDGAVMLGSAVVPVVDVIAAVLARVGEETRRQLAGHAPDRVVLTHPAQWGVSRRAVLQNAAGKAGFTTGLTLLPEPVAAAVHFASLQSGGDPASRPPALAVYDLGGGTFDCAVVTIGNGRYLVASDDGLPDVGGVDFDQALLDQLGRMTSSADPTRWRNLLRPATSADRRAARALREDVRTAKETLSRYPQSDVPLPEPYDDALVSRAEFEGLIRPMVIRTVDLLAATIERAGYSRGQLARIYLVGGSSRIPLVGKEISDRLGVVPITLEQPETAVALGAALWPAESRTAQATGPGVGASSVAGPGQVPALRRQAGPVFGPTPAPPPAPPAAPRVSPGRPQPAVPVGSSGQPDDGRPWSTPDVSPDGAPSARNRKSGRGPVIAVVATVALLLAVATTLVLANRGGRAADPGTGTRSPSSRSSSPGALGGAQPDPTGCTVDKTNAQGLTDCMAELAGNLVNGSECTKDAGKLQLSQQEVDNFGALAPVWAACFSGDGRFLSLLFQHTNGAARNASWQTTLTLVEPQQCGTFLSSSRPRGIYVVGVWKADGEPAVLWQDTALPLFGILRPPGSNSALRVHDALTYFAGTSGFRLDSQDCDRIVEGGVGSTSAAGTGTSTAGIGSGSAGTGTSTASPGSGTAGTGTSTAGIGSGSAGTGTAGTGSSQVDPDSCPTTPLDGNHMSPCIKKIAGKALRAKVLCVPDEKLLEPLTTALKNAGMSAAALSSCAFRQPDLNATTIYLQFSNTRDRDTVFSSMSGDGTAGSWSQGGRSGRSTPSIPKAGQVQIVWSIDNLPIVAYVQAQPPDGGTMTDAELQAKLTAFWRSTLLPSG